MSIPVDSVPTHGTPLIRRIGDPRQVHRSPNPGRHLRRLAVPVARDESPPRCIVRSRAGLGGPYIEAAGELDRTSWPALQVQLDQMTLMARARMVIDLQAVELIDDWVTGEIAAAVAGAAARHGMVDIICRPGPVADRLTASGLDWMPPSA